MRKPSAKLEGIELREGPVVLKWTAGVLAAIGLVVLCYQAAMWDFSRETGRSLTSVSKAESAKGLSAKGKDRGVPALNTDPAALPARFIDREPVQSPWRQACAALVAIKNDAEREKAIDSLIYGLDPAALLSAIHFLSGQESDGWSQDIARRMIRHLAETDPALAADGVERLPEGREREQAMEDVAIVWANRNVADSAKWVRQWPDDEMRERGMIGITYEAARGDAMSAMTMAAELSPSPARDDLINHVAAQWAATDPQVAAEWAKKIPDAALRARVSGTIATEWAGRDPIAAATMAAAQLPAGRIRDDAVVGIVERWAQIDPNGAQAWVQQFPGGSLRETAMDNLAKLRPEQTP